MPTFLLPHHQGCSVLWCVNSSPNVALCHMDQPAHGEKEVSKAGRNISALELQYSQVPISDQELDL